MHKFMQQSRRRFLANTVSGAATLTGFFDAVASAEQPPETTTVRLTKFFPSGCEGPQYIARELLRAEGFTDVRYVEGDTTVDSSVWMARGEIDFDWNYAAVHITSIESGVPIKVLTGLHSGCLELIANESVGDVKDLKGKRVGVYSLSSSPHILVTLMAAYIGLDPVSDIQWVTNKDTLPKDLFVEGKIDAFLATAPEPQDLRARKIGRTILDTGVDRPWSQYYCCMLAGSSDYTSKYPVATKRVMRALLKAVDICASNPLTVAKQLSNGKFTDNYDYALEILRDIRYDRWREFDPEDTMRFYALRLNEIGKTSATPDKIISDGTDWRFLQELKQELKT